MLDLAIGTIDAALRSGARRIPAEYPDFLHTTYEMSWVGLAEEDAHEGAVALESMRHGQALPCRLIARARAAPVTERSCFCASSSDAG